ncbi:MAG: RNA ligase family protein [Candidatus Micrarchaeia archaeon]
MIPAYPKVYSLGHKAIKNIFSTPVLVEEKIDGSQFSFMINENGELFCRSKNVQLNLDNPDALFNKAVDIVKSIKDKLIPGWIYRAEYLQRPNHNVLKYSRVPSNHLIGFDIEVGLQEFANYDIKKFEFEQIGLECVPKLYEGEINSVDEIKSLLETESVLGGEKIEGIVIKNYNLFTDEKKIMIGKFVSERFKETAKEVWKAGENPVIALGKSLATEARWLKAVQHLAENGELEFSPRDIGKLMSEIINDTLEEEKDFIKDSLYSIFIKDIKREITRGFPEWYKNYLLERSFDA